MVTATDPLFKKYLTHVLQWEGLTSKDAADTAVSCAPYAGAVHTNKGVTFCTFRENAAALGITPVTHERFLKLTNDDIGKFVLLFMQKAEASTLPTVIALSVTEAAWGSGPARAVIHLQSALNKMGYSLAVDGVTGAKTKAAAAAAAKSDLKRLYELFWIERRSFLNYLVSQPKYAKWKNGWNNRVNSFLKLFPVSTAVKVAAGGLGLAVAFFLPFIF